MQVLDKGYVEYINSMGTDQTIVDSARVSFLGESKSEDRDKALINYLAKNYHHSPFEHITMTVMIKCPLFVRSQIMRHRASSFNEVSRRYTSEEIEFYIPKTLRKQATIDKQMSSDSEIEFLEFTNHYGDDISDTWSPKPEDYISFISSLLLGYYNDLLDAGVAREQARMILPQNMYTKFYMTCDLRNWFHFLALRNDEHAQWETRQFAIAIEDIISEKFPVAYLAYLDNKEKFK